MHMLKSNRTGCTRGAAAPVTTARLANRCLALLQALFLLLREGRLLFSLVALLAHRRSSHRRMSTRNFRRGRAVVLRVRN